MRTKTFSTTKAKATHPSNISFDASYAEILAEVQKLQQMLDGNIQTEPKQRKKRTVKAKVEDTQVQASTGEVQHEEGDDMQETKHQTEAIDNDNANADTKASKNRYKVSNLDEIREKISEVKELIQEAGPEAAIGAAEPSEPEAKIFQTTKDVVEENTDIAIEPQNAPAIEDDKATSSKAKASDNDEDPDLVPPHGLKADKAQSDLDAYFMDGKDAPSKSETHVGLAEERHAAQLAKHGVKNEKEIVKANLEHDKSGTDWGGSVNLEEDPSLDHPQP